jgi:CRISPR-associated protein Cmr3
MRLFIEPNDVWLFRDGRPFDVYAGHRAHTLFPPFPTVVQGMIRSAHLAFCNVRLDDYLRGNAPKEIIEAIGAPSTAPPFKLRGPFVAKLGANQPTQRFFPRPAEAYLIDASYVALKPREPEANTLSNIPDGLRLLYPTREPKEKASGKVSGLDDWWPETVLQNYLRDGEVAQAELRQAAGGKKAGNLDSPISIWKSEDRFGVHLQSDIRRPRDGFIYEIEYARLEDGFGLEIEVQGLPDEQWPQTGMVRLGGDGRAARFTRLDGPLALPPVETVGDKTKVYFATPAYFAGGWKPENWAIFFAGHAELVAAALDKPLAVGGIDLANAEKSARSDEAATAMHKPARRYVQAGSVYFFAGSLKLQENVLGVTDDGQNLGFGQIIFGRW